MKHERGISFYFSLLVGCATETDEGLRSAVDDIAAVVGRGSGGAHCGARFVLLREITRGNSNLGIK